MEFQNVLRHRRMVRRFLPDRVPREVLERVLDAALRGPSAGFSQGIHLLVLDGPEEVSRFSRATNHPRLHHHAEAGGQVPPVIVLPFSDKREYLARYSRPDKAGAGLHVEVGWPVPYWDLDAAMAVMLMLLAAVDEGLGGWFFGIFRGELELLHELGVPEGPRLIGAVGLGYPDPSERPVGSAYNLRRRSRDETVHWGRW